ncbi:site-specific DNA-methyltransferase [Paraphotobacterium marinum]|uniref:site-specific DNA-methyltransferase (adenine-specific) n=1 Tax=Paraphotobacterium marinum TaxID=1755811 RepID=A0A220VFW7_9GAMM|nr:site-specific DNA-methyltransferase [Paraphotobacterium marinum]ASK79126.1 site-specific DNA-methyltransferase [Paraphotobacterium marinum]
MLKMEKITIDSPESKSINITNKNIEQLKQLFPEVISEGRINFDTLKKLLGDEVDESDERYNFTWNGKNKALKIAQTPSLGTLRPCKEESINWNTTENLFIEGDNLEVLKLLQKSYHKKIKMIYIDPPYNTGKDFVYKDNFHDNINNYLNVSGQVDSEGYKLSSNTEKSGRYHSDWLNMIYPRLKLSRNLLRDDGIIFISIDDNEVANLLKVCNEIFGEDNFISNIVHKSRASISNDKIISSNHNHILLYAKNKSVIHEYRKQFGLEANLDDFKLKDNKGYYKYAPVDGPGGEAKGNPYYEFMGVEGYFRFSKEKMSKLYQEGKVIKVGNGLQQKLYKKDFQFSRKTVTTWWDEKLYTSSATQQLKKMLGGDYFDSPKHIALIQKMIELWARNDGDIILDFFAGSGTTGQSVLEYKKNIKFILVQLPEPIKTFNYKRNSLKVDKDQDKEEFKVISDITKKRLFLTAKSLKNSNNGFKVFKLDKTNILPWDADFENLEYIIKQSTQSIMDDRTSEDVLYEILLKYGYELTASVDKKVINENTIFVVAEGSLFVCLDDQISLETVEIIVRLKEEYDPEMTQVVFKDEGFTSDIVKTNAIQILKQADIDDVKSI